MSLLNVIFTPHHWGHGVGSIQIITFFKFLVFFVLFVGIVLAFLRMVASSTYTTHIMFLFLFRFT